MPKHIVKLSNRVYFDINSVVSIEAFSSGYGSGNTPYISIGLYGKPKELNIGYDTYAFCVQVAEKIYNLWMEHNKTNEININV